MVASYPGTVRVFTQKADLSDTVYAEHPNSLQDEVIALEQVVGLNPHLSTSPSPSGSFNASSTLFSSVAARLANIEVGIVADAHNQYVRKTGGDVVQAGSASTVGLRVRGATSQTADLLQLLSGTGSTVAAFSADGSLSVNNLTVNGTQTNIAGSATALDLGATTGIAAGTGANFGDKIQLYQSSYGFGMQSNRMVAFLPANAGFAVRQKAGSGYASSGTDAVVLGVDGSVTATGVGSFLDVLSAGQSAARGLLSYTRPTATGGVSTETNIASNGSVSFTVSGSRRVVIEGRYVAQNSTANDEIIVSVYLDGSKIASDWDTPTVTNRFTRLSAKATTIVANGSHTVRATLARGAGTDTVNLNVQNGDGVYIYDVGD